MHHFLVGVPAYVQGAPEVEVAARHLPLLGQFLGVREAGQRLQVAIGQFDLIVVRQRRLGPHPQLALREGIGYLPLLGDAVRVPGVLVVFLRGRPGGDVHDGAVVGEVTAVARPGEEEQAAVARQGQVGRGLRQRREVDGGDVGEWGVRSAGRQQHGAAEPGGDRGRRRASTGPRRAAPCRSTGRSRRPGCPVGPLRRGNGPVARVAFRKSRDQGRARH